MFTNDSGSYNDFEYRNDNPVFEYNDDPSIQRIKESYAYKFYGGKEKGIVIFLYIVLVLLFALLIYLIIIRVRSSRVTKITKQQTIHKQRSINNNYMYPSIPYI